VTLAMMARVLLRRSTMCAVHLASVSIVLSLVSLSACTRTGAGDHARSGGSFAVEREREVMDSKTLAGNFAKGGVARIDPALAIGVFPAEIRRDSSLTPSHDLRSMAQFRVQLADSPERAPLTSDAQAFLRQAAEALRNGDEERAIAAADAALRASPTRVEPLELLLLANLSRGSTQEVRSVLDKIVIADPRNAIGVAFRGLEAVQRGRRGEALGYLAWFIGDGALAPRGASIPLPTAPREIEEQAALCALSLGAGSAALEALDAADAQVDPNIDSQRPSTADPNANATTTGTSVTDPHASVAQRQLLRADALVMVGRVDDARAMLERIASDQTSLFAVRTMAELRLDALAESPSDFVVRLRSACVPPISEVTLWRTLENFARVQPEMRDAAFAPLRADLAVVAQKGDRRAAVLRDLLSSQDNSASDISALFDLCVSRDTLDGLTFRLVVRAALRSDPKAVIEALVVLIERRPELVDLAAQALLSGPYDADEIAALLERYATLQTKEALIARVFALYGSTELGLSKALAALARDPASAVPLAAAIYCASELRDGTLLLTLEETAREAGCAACAALHVAWSNIGDPARAAQFERPAGLSPDRSEPRSDANLASRDAEFLQRDARTLLGARLTTGDESLVLLDALAPELRSLESLRARLGTAAEPLGMQRAARALESSWPGRPAVEAFLDACALAAADQDLNDQDLTDQDSNGRAVAAGGIRDEFRRRQRMTPADRQALQMANAQRRPRTPEAIAAEALALVAMGDVSRAAACVEAASKVIAPTLSQQGATSLLRAAALVATTRREEAQRMSRATRGLVDRVVFLEVRDVGDAMRLALLAGMPLEDIRALAVRCAEMSRRLDAAKLPQVFAMLRVIVELNGGTDLLAVSNDAIGNSTVPSEASEVVKSSESSESAEALRSAVLSGDPYPAALLASSFAREPRHDPLVRAALARTAIALFAVSGGSDAESAHLVETLTAEGVAPFASRASDTRGIGKNGESREAGPSAALMLLRASDVHALLGDDAGSAALLRASLELDPALPSALNNLAYRDLQSCNVTDETRRMAESAASQEPSNPSILDTLGLLRLSEGALRDGPEGLGALTLFRQALRLNPENPSLEALDHLGDAMWRDGDQQGAIRCWQQVAQLAELRYPPEGIARRLMESQRTEFGLELVDPAEYLRRSYGAVVDRALLKVDAVAKGMVPRVFDCAGNP